jgi:hypothetical protein
MDLLDRRVPQAPLVLGLLIVPDPSGVDQNIDRSETNLHRLRELLYGFLSTEICAEDLSARLADQPPGLLQTMARSCHQANPSPRGTQSHSYFSS